MKHTEPMIAEILMLLKQLHPGALRRVLHFVERELEKQTQLL